MLNRAGLRAMRSFSRRSEILPVAPCFSADQNAWWLNLHTDSSQHCMRYRLPNQRCGAENAGLSEVSHIRLKTPSRRANRFLGVSSSTIRPASRTRTWS